MTFDDGRVTFYEVTNGEENGYEPQKVLAPKCVFAYAEQTVGYSRYYDAIKAGTTIDRLIAIYENPATDTNQVAVLEDGEQYLVGQIQHTQDENGIKIQRITLSRNGESYEVSS